MKKPKTVVFSVVAIIGIYAANGNASDAASSDSETRFLSNVRQVTFEGRRAGEGYFNADGSKMIFQSERDPANPFYQIFLLDLNTGDTQLVSPGYGKTTCAWIHPDGQRALFASTHEDLKSLEHQKAELEKRATGKTKRYEWDYDEFYEIYTTEFGSNKYTNLTNARGYDAEGSYSPDGKWIAFSSNRHAFTDKLSAEDQRLLETDAKYFLDIYIMRADGSDVKRLTDVPGYDGGPFFSPDGKRICWRRFTPDGNVAEIWTMNINGSDQKQITKLGGMSWAPFYHPSGDYLIFTTDINGRSNFELYVVDTEGKHEPVRVSNLPGFDGLPVFFPDGKRLAWTANRTENKKGQIFFADFDDAAARKTITHAQERTGNKPASPKDGNSLSPTTAEQPGTLRDRILALIKSSDRINWNTVNPGHEKYVEFETSVDGSEGTFIQFVLRSTAHPNRKPLFLMYSIEYLFTNFTSAGFDADMTALVEIAESLSPKSKDGPLRTIYVHLMIDVVESRRSELFGAIASTFGDDLAASVEFRDLRASVNEYVVDGVRTSPRWSKHIERHNVLVGLPLKVSDTPQADSLGFALYEKSVPSIAIRPSEMQRQSNESAVPNKRVIEFISRLVGALIIDPSSPEFTPITKRKDAVVGRPYLGTEPDYRAQVEGVLLKGVKENGPAHLGGMRAGDVIVQIGDASIKDVQGYADALDKLSAGETVLIHVMRDGERVLLRVTVGAREQ